MLFKYFQKHHFYQSKLFQWFKVYAACVCNTSRLGGKQTKLVN